MNIMLHEKRFLATLIDGGIGLLLSLVFSLLLNIVLKIEFMNFDYYYLFMYTFTMFLYQFFCFLICKDQTIGLHLVSLKLLSSDWEKISIKQNLLRSMAIAIPILFVINILYMIIYKTKSTTLFDDVSDTIVVNTGMNYNVESKKVIDIIKKHTNEEK